MLYKNVYLEKFNKIKSLLSMSAMLTIHPDVYDFICNSAHRIYFLKKKMFI